MPTIIIVDDDEEVRVAIQNLVQSYGLTARTFPSAEALLDSEDIMSMDCLVTDIQMPGMSGLELQHILRTQRPDIRTVFITAFPEERVRREAEFAGALGFLSKPFDATQLMACIEQALTLGGKSISP